MFKKFMEQPNKGPRQRGRDNESLLPSEKTAKSLHLIGHFAIFTKEEGVKTTTEVRSR